MALETRLLQKLSQSLLMTPQLQQAIKLLQLGRLEYIHAIEQELLENPALELLENEEAEQSNQRNEDQASSAQQSDETTNDARAAEESHASTEEYFDSYSDYTPSRNSHLDQDSRYSIETAVASPENLIEHLVSQLRVSDLQPDEQPIAIHAVGNLNSDGYLTVSYDDIAHATKSSVDDVERVMSIIKGFDPPGVGARDLSECLIIQLEKIGLGDSLAACIARNHLPMLERHRYDTIAKGEDVPIEDVYEAVLLIRSLEPRPGIQFYESPTRYIVPDIYVHKIGVDWVITLNDDGLPRLRVNQRYLEMLKDGESLDPEQRTYLHERLKAASWLIKSIHQRQTTIYRVTESIIKFQRDFFEHGIEHLRPLVLKAVAEDIGMHESTVSRVTTSKYVHTPQGVFELKYFFTSGIMTSDGERSSSTIKELIRSMIAEEDPKSPINDQELVERLNRENIQIARRTVAKYRESLGILSSVKRKKLF